MSIEKQSSQPGGVDIDEQVEEVRQVRNHKGSEHEHQLRGVGKVVAQS